MLWYNALVDLGAKISHRLWSMFPGAELASLCREAAIASLREDMAGATEVAARHFAAARAALRPMLTPESLVQYEGFGRRT